MSLQYVIDAYNVINHSLFPRKGKQGHSEVATLLSLSKINKLLRSPYNKVTVVFDGFPSQGAALALSNRVKILFSRELSADEVIKRLLEESSQKKNIVVVSDDKEIAYFTRISGCRHENVSDFMEEENSRKTLLKDENRKDSKDELNFSQISRINEELKKVWLKSRERSE